MTQKQIEEMIVSALEKRDGEVPLEVMLLVTKTAMDIHHLMQDFLFHCFSEQIFWDYAKKWSAADWVKAITPILETKGF